MYQILSATMLVFILIYIPVFTFAFGSNYSDGTLVQRNLRNRFGTKSIAAKSEKDLRNMDESSQQSNRSMASIGLGDIKSFCAKDISIPISFLGADSTLWLEFCLKLILFNTGWSKQDTGYIVDKSSGLQVNINSIRRGNDIITQIDLIKVYPMPPKPFNDFQIEIQIHKSKENTFYWNLLRVSSSFSNMKFWTETLSNQRLFEADLQNSYSCEFPMTLLLDKNIYVHMNNLRYRAFRKIETQIWDNDIQTCKLSPWIIDTVGGFILVLILVTLATIICSCRKHRHRRGYTNFQNRFEA